MSPRPAVVRAAARRDLAKHADWLHEEAGPEVSSRFLHAAQATFVTLAETPGLGSVVPTRLVSLAGARKWRVKDFPDQLIFFLVQEDAVVILRVLHAASDWRA